MCSVIYLLFSHIFLRACHCCHHRRRRHLCRIIPFTLIMASDNVVGTSGAKSTTTLNDARAVHACVVQQLAATKIAPCHSRTFHHATKGNEPRFFIYSSDSSDRTWSYRRRMLVPSTQSVVRDTFNHGRLIRSEIRVRAVWKAKTRAYIFWFKELL